MRSKNRRCHETKIGAPLLRLVYAPTANTRMMADLLNDPQANSSKRDRAMSEMVERVARAIFEKRYKAPGTHQFLPWEQYGNQEIYRKDARAAIEAMHEPTDEMLGYGERVLDETGSVRDAYVAMTHAAYSREFPY